MKSSDYLYEILRQNSNGDYIIAGKRYCVGTVKTASGWKDCICRMRYQNVFAVTEPFASDTEAWAHFLSREYPSLLAKWSQAEKKGSVAA